ncbi:MAG: MarR family winged helix-turn-helix transcriptional regulator, partial [Planctomycetaceae bacterium]
AGGGGGGESALLQRLIDLAWRIRDRLAERCEAEGVSPSRFALLQAIADGNDDGCSQTELAAGLGLSESNVCSLVERMRTSGLLFRFRSKTDRRKSVLMLSARGRELAQAISRTQRIEAESLVSTLDAEQRVELQQLLDQWHKYLDAMPQLVVATSEESETGQWDSSSFDPAQAAPGAERTSRRAS